jgi:hypothetical protein
MRYAALHPIRIDDKVVTDTVPLKYLKLSWKETTASGSMKKSS